jgi:hypothetical protein
MIEQIALEAFNSRVTVNLNNIKTMTPAQLDRIKATGSEAEALLKNKQLALFIHTTKFELTDSLSAIVGHSLEDNNRRVAISNQLAGLQSFIDTLTRSVYYKKRVVNHQNGSHDPTENNKEVL